MVKKTKSTLAENATLVRLTAKNFSGVKVDREARKALAKEFNANEKSLQSNKHLLGTPCSAPFRSIVNRFRNDNGGYLEVTLPWHDNTPAENTSNKTQVVGWRICPNKELQGLLDKFQESKREFDSLKEEFIKDYPKRVEASKKALGGLWKRQDYPSQSEVEDKFYYHLEVGGVPTGKKEGEVDIRLNLSKELRERIEADAERRIRQSVENAAKDTVESLLSEVSHLATKLVEYDPKNKQKSFFKDASFDNLRDTLSKLPTINEDILGGNSDIKKAHQKLVKTFSTIGSDLESYREDTAESKAKRDTLSESLDKSVDNLKDSFLGKAFK
jgi:hypothetical protein